MCKELSHVSIGLVRCADCRAVRGKRIVRSESRIRRAGSHGSGHLHVPRWWTSRPLRWFRECEHRRWQQRHVRYSHWIHCIHQRHPLPPPGGILDEITFPAAPLLHFNATSVDPGIFGSAQCALAPAVGQTCTLPGSPFNLTNVGQGSTLSFELDGNFVDLSDGKADPTPYHGIFTAQFSGKSYQQVLASIDGVDRVTTSYSASFAPSVIPEASSVVMLSAGLLAFGALGWRRSRHGSDLHKGTIEACLSGIASSQRF